MTESTKFFKKPERSDDTPVVVPKLIKHLKSQSLFKHTPEDVLAKIASKIEMRKLAQGETLLREGDPGDSLFIIRLGWFKIVTQNAEGEEVMLNQYGPGQIIGEMSLIDRKPRSNTVIALRPAEVMEIKYDVVLTILDEHPVLARSFLQEMSSRVRFANAYIEEAIEWCRQIATGNYDFVQNQVKQSQSTIIDMTQSHQARASAFLSVFFKMIEGVRKREDELKQQVRELTIQIDEVKRQQAVRELTETDFFEDLQDAARKLRQKRKRPGQPDDKED